MIDAPDYAAILKIIAGWPLAQRLILLHDVLRTLAPEETALPRRPTLSLALGLLATNQPPPSDVQVEEWQEEHRMEKYG